MLALQILARQRRSKVGVLPRHQLHHSPCFPGRYAPAQRSPAQSVDHTPLPPLAEPLQQFPESPLAHPQLPSCLVLQQMSLLLMQHLQPVPFPLSIFKSSSVSATLHCLTLLRNFLLCPLRNFSRCCDTHPPLARQRRSYSA